MSKVQRPRGASDRARPIPRRWSDTIDGIRWLPRLIDKARMAEAGDLGAYLFGHSPFDAALLRRLRVSTAEFGAIVAAAPDDAAVLARLRERGFDESRVRRWSDRLPRSARLFIPYWDADDGYARLGPVASTVVAIWRAVEYPVMAVVRAFLRAP